jgi:hypothetical protein
MSYSRIADHSSMVFDGNRNEAYGRALRQSVQAGSVVLDLGAGVGIHGLLAAAAGAARVYLVDPEPVVQLARSAAQANGFGDRVVVLQDRIEETRLPEKADVLVSVLTGNMLFSEDLLPSLFHARDHYLKPGGTMVPDRAQLLLAPLCAPQLHERQVARWSAPVMDLDYSTVRPLAANELVGMSREQLRGISYLAPAVAVADIDLMRADKADCAGSATCTVETSGLCHGLLGTIRIRLADEWLTTQPDAPEVHWSPVYLPIDPPLPLQAGEELTIELVRPAFGDWTWVLSAAAGTRRHSTFLASADGPEQWRRAAPATAPGLGARGRRTLAILRGLGEGKSNAVAAAELAKSEGLSDHEALRQVQAMALRYGERS